MLAHVLTAYLHFLGMMTLELGLLLVIPLLAVLMARGIGRTL
jgi:uncharacterized membrane protein